MRILIDPGHGGENTGARSGTHVESCLNLRLCLAAEPLLWDLPAEVSLTRREDVRLSLRDRADIATRCASDVVISVHHNASRNDEAYGGQLYHWPSNAKTRGICVRAANYLPHELKNRHSVQPAGDKTPDAKSLLSAFRQPVILLECLHLTAPHDLNYLESQWYMPEMITTLRALVTAAAKEYECCLIAGNPARSSSACRSR